MGAFVDATNERAGNRHLRMKFFQVRSGGYRLKIRGPTRALKNT
jgi:hypothetical protein